jgi:hypothetical protein
MTFPIQINFHGMESAPAIDGKVRERIAKLERLAPRITACRVVLEAPNRVHLVVRFPGTLLSVSKGGQRDGAAPDLTLACRQAFDAAERALRELTRAHAA